MGRRYPIGVALSITVLLLATAFSGTVWGYENAQDHGRAALAERADRMRDQQAGLVFWHQREAINEYLITDAPDALAEARTLQDEFFRVTDGLADDRGESVHVAEARSANLRLFEAFELRVAATRHPSAARSVKFLHPFEEAVLAPLRTLNSLDLVRERELSKSAAAASRQARLAVILGALVTLLAGLGFVIYVSRLLRQVTAQAVVVATLEERERTHAEQQHRELQLRQAQKTEAVGRLAGGVAHDFNNMLLAITGYGALALAELDPAQSSVRHSIEQIELAAGRAAVLTAQLLAFSRQQVLQTQVVDINGLVNGLTEMLRPLLGARTELRVELDSSAGAVESDPGQLEQVITNLVLNGRDAMPAGGRITIRTATADPSEVPVGLPTGRYMAITVTDTGEGMDEETQSRALDPFFTTKELGKGTGLGLATVQGIVAQSGGDLRIDSAPGAGTTIAIYLPVTDAAPAPAVTASSIAATGTETVLLVEDNLAVQSMLLEVFELHGYDVLAASDGAEALLVAARTDVAPDLLITDMVMPGMGGRELANKLQSIYPAMRAIYVSGYSQDTSLYDDAEAGRITFLQKPFTPNDVLRTVREVLDPPVP